MGLKHHICIIAGLLSSCYSYESHCPQYIQTSAHTVQTDELVEISGLAAGPGDSVWAIQDSGTPYDEYLYRLSLDGETLDRMHIIGVDNVDWEDLALDADTGQLWISDSGNNYLSRYQYPMYILEPHLGWESIEPLYYRRPVLELIDGPANVEALSIRDGKPELWPKIPRAVRYTHLEAGLMWPDEVIRLPDPIERGSTWHHNIVTAAEHLDGYTYLRTQRRIFRITDWSGEICELPSAPELQGESIAVFDWGYVTISEGRNQAINVFERL